MMGERPKSAVLSREAESLPIRRRNQFSSHASLCHDKNLGSRTLSASNLNALSDSNLSLRTALPRRSYDVPRSAEARAKFVFVQTVRRHFYQLVEGCGNHDCDNRFCLSCPHGLSLHPGMAFVFSIQLCSRSSPRFCSSGSEHFVHKIIPKSVLDAPRDQPQPFLYALYGSTPFQTLFEEIREEEEEGEELPPSNYSSRPPSPPLSVDENFGRRSRPQSLTLCPSSDSRERRNSAPHLVNNLVDNVESLVDCADSRQGVVRALQQRHLPRQHQQHPFLAKTHRQQLGQQTMHGSLGDLSPQTLIKTKAIRKIRAEAPPRLVGQSWIGDKIGASLDFGRHKTVVDKNGVSSLASSLASLDLPLNDDDDDCDVGVDDDDADDGCPFASGDAAAAVDAAAAAAASGFGDSDLRLSPPLISPPSEFSLTHMTTTMVESVLEDFRITNDPAFILNSVRTVFGSYEAMASSFLSSEETVEITPAVTEANGANIETNEAVKAKAADAESKLIEAEKGRNEEKGANTKTGVIEVEVEEIEKEIVVDKRESDKAETDKTETQMGGTETIKEKERDGYHRVDRKKDAREVEAKENRIPVDFKVEHGSTPFTDDAEYAIPSMQRATSSTDAISSSPSPNVDIVGAVGCFRRLWNLEPVVEEMRQTTTDALEILLTDLSKDENLLERKAFPRTLLLIVLHPIFGGSFRAGLSSVVLKLAQIFALVASQCSSSSSSSSSSFANHLSAMPCDCLVSLVQRFKELLAVGRPPVKMEPAVKRSLSSVCSALALLHSVCLDRDDVGIETFYCDQVCQQLDLTQEYDAWRKTMTKADEADDANKLSRPFSFLSFPFLLDPPTKVRVLHLDACAHMRIRYQEAIVHQAIVNQVEKYKKMLNRSLPIPRQVKASMCPFLVLEIRRDHLIEDAFRQLELKSEDLKKPLRISYVGSGEQGLDMGGLQKEFFQVVTNSLFIPEDEKDAFIPLLTPSNLHWFSSDAYFSSVFSSSSFASSLSSSSSSSSSLSFVEDPFDVWRFVGILLGLAVYNGIIIPAQFPLALYKKMLGQPCDLSDLREMEPSVHRSLTELLAYEGDDFDQVFCLNFQTQAPNGDNSVQLVDLIPGGSEIPVTLANRSAFVSSYISFLLDSRHRRQFSAFLSGFRLVAADIALNLFRPRELQLLIAGTNQLDFKALELSCQYEDGYSATHPTIRFLWSVVHEDLSEEEKKNFLHFITGSDRVPLQGLGKMPLMIQWHGDDSDRLPSAMTCFNRLLLPQYDSRTKLKSKLTIALQNAKGFGLS